MNDIVVGVKPESARQILPKEAYTSQEWFDREQRELFSRIWTYACLSSDIPNPGDYQCVQVGLYPMIVMRGQDGVVRALHNSCRHRGASILEGTGNIERNIICPYHRWTYTKEGDLRGIPQEKELFSGKVNKCELSLKAGSIGVYREIIFIHPEASPQESFDDYLADLPENTWPANTESAMVLTRTAWEMNCNWKTFVENAQDGYHLSHLHKDTLQGPTTSDQSWRPHGRHWHWSGNSSIMQTTSERMSAKDKAKMALSSLWSDWKPLDGVDLDTYGGEVFGFFPTFLVQPVLDNVGFAKLVPVSPDKTILELFVMVAPWKSEKEKASRLKYINEFAPLPGVGYGKDGSPTIKDRPLRLTDISGDPLKSGNFHVEDVWQVEMVSKALKSPASEIGPLSDGDGETALTYFQQMIADYVPVEGGQK